MALCVLHPFAGGGQKPTLAPANAEHQPQAFDVASVKRAGPNENMGFFFPSPGSFSARNVTAIQLILFAYRSRSAAEPDEGIVKPDQIVGLPGWTRTDRYDIDAKVLSDASSLQNAPQEQQREANQQRLTSLLVERFELKYHYETRERRVFELVVKGKPQLTESHTLTHACVMRLWTGNMRFTDCPIDQLAFNLAYEDEIDQIVLNKTGLQGYYDLRLSWTEDQQEQTEGASSLISALREQLGLALVPVKGPVPILVVDHIERPTPN